MIEAPKRAETPTPNLQPEPLICNVSLYFDLKNQVLKKTNGNQDLAREAILEAITNDGVSLIQENISSLIPDMDPFFRASFQLTPTENTYLENIDQAGNKIISSPEHQILQKSIKDGVTEWRRGNDQASVGFIEALFYQVEEGDTILWSSPKAEDWEEPLVQRFNGAYGYLYKGKIISEEGKRKMLVHSYRVDSKTSVYQNLYESLEGSYIQSSPDEPTKDKVYKDSPEDLIDLKQAILEPKRPFLDTLMRSAVITHEELDNKSMWQKIFKSKKATGEEEKNLNLSLDSLLFVQDESLREKIRQEVSAPVAKWLVEEMEKGTTSDILQFKIKDKYIQKTQDLVKKIEREKIKLYPSHPPPTPSLLIQSEIKNYKQEKGEFCGGWGDQGINLPGSRTNVLNQRINLPTSSSAKLETRKSCGKCFRSSSEVTLGPCGVCTSCE